MTCIYIGLSNATVSRHCAGLMVFFWQLADFMQNFAKYYYQILSFLMFEFNTRQAGIITYDSVITATCRLFDRMTS